MKAFLLTIALATVSVTADICQERDTAWGDANPNVFHICNKKTNASLTFDCLADSGYVQNHHYDGCLPFAEWDCNLGVAEVDMLPTCTDGLIAKPWRHSNPNKFYMCDGDEIVEAQCAAGRGFVSTPDVLGCLPWADWRENSRCHSQVDNAVPLATLEGIYKLFSSFLEQLKIVIGSLKGQ